MRKAKMNIEGAFNLDSEKMFLGKYIRVKPQRRVSISQIDVEDERIFFFQKEHHERLVLRCLLQ